MHVRRRCNFLFLRQHYVDEPAIALYAHGRTGLGGAFNPSFPEVTVGRRQRQQASVDAQELWLRSERVDVLAAQGLGVYDEAKFKKGAARWGHAHAVFMPVRSKYHLGLSSRTPIRVVAQTTDGMKHGLLHCQTAGIDFIVVHLHPSSFKSRLSEMKIIQKIVRAVRARGGHSVLLGSLNSLSRFDQKFYARNAQGMPIGSGNGNRGVPDYTVIDAALASPLVDVHARHLSDHKKARTWQGPEGTDLVRADYILASAKLESKCISVRVENSDALKALADHFPVIATFSWAFDHEGKPKDLSLDQREKR